MAKIKSFSIREDVKVGDVLGQYSSVTFSVHLNVEIEEGDNVPKTISKYVDNCHAMIRGKILQKFGVDIEVKGD